MTDTTPAERERLQRVRMFDAICDALPEGVHWSDPLTPEIAQHIWQAALSQQQARAASQPAQEPVDAGPWSAGGSDDGTKAWVDSHDFTHDVRLHISGDFADDKQRFAYAEELARRLNAAFIYGSKDETLPS